MQLFFVYLELNISHIYPVYIKFTQYFIKFSDNFRSTAVNLSVTEVENKLTISSPCAAPEISKNYLKRTLIFRNKNLQKKKKEYKKY